MAVIIRSKVSRADLAELWCRAARDSAGTADRLVKRFDRRLKRLAASPLLGRRRPELASDVWCLPIGKAVVFYTPFDGGILVARILHCSLDSGAGRSAQA